LIIKKKINNNLILLGFIFCLLILLLLLPYWVFGKYSAIGWYDEADFHIPILSYIAQNPDDKFWPNWAGGTPTSSLIWESNAYVSLTKILFMIFGPWMGSLIYRFVDYAVLAYITYQLCGIIGVRKLLIIPFGLILMSTGATQYGWQLGGLNFLYTLSLFFICLIEKPNNLSRFDICLFGGIIVLAGYPIYTMFAPCLILLCYIFIDKNKIYDVIKKHWVFIIIIFSLYIINYFPYIKFLNVLSYSARAQNFGGLNLEYIKPPNLDWSSLKWWFLPLIDYFSGYSKRFDSISLYLISGSFFISLFCKESRRIALVGIIFLCIVDLLDRVKFLSFLSIIRSVRFDQLFDLVPFLSAIPLIFIMNSKSIGNISKKFGIIFIILFLINGTYARFKDIERVFLDIPEYGGFQMFNIGELKSIDLSNARVISNGYLPKSFLGPMNEKFSFDGIRPNSSIERVIFFRNFLYQNFDGPVHPTKQYVMNSYSIDNLNINALNMANISYAFNQKLGVPKDATVIKKFESTRIHDIYPKWILSYIQDVKISPEFSLLNLNNKPWGFLFKPTNIKLYVDRGIDSDYLQNLKELKFREVLLPMGFVDYAKVSSNSPSSITLKFLPNGMSVEGDISRQLLILNFEPFYGMRAECNGVSILYTRVNLIQTAFYVPEDCKAVSFLYE
jgi:hypothetical protein